MSRMPDPFALALALTLVAAAVALGVGDLGPRELLDAWAGSKGMWNLLGFAMQMALILVTGFVVAATGPVRRALHAVATVPSTPTQAVAVVATVAIALGWLNWGLGLIAGALLARDIARRLHETSGVAVAPLLAAAGYLPLSLWHGGLSGSAPLKTTTEEQLANVVGAELAAAVGPIGLEHTLFSVRNLVTMPLVAGVSVATLLLLHRRGWGLGRAPAPAEPEPPADDGSPLDHGPWLSAPVALAGLLWLALWAVDGGWRRLSPNEINLFFLCLGLLFAGSPAAYMAHAGRAAGSIAGVVVQFPFYAGIMGLLVASGAAHRLVDLWAPEGSAALSVATFLSAGLLNVFVPSGGGQWAIQGPVVLAMGQQAGVDPGRLVLAVAWGDQWTNLFQPFWALPLLGITGVSARDLFPLTATVGLVVAPVLALAIALG